VVSFIIMLSCDMVPMLSWVPAALAGASAFLEPPQALRATRTAATITFLIPAPVWGWADSNARKSSRGPREVKRCRRAADMGNQLRVKGLNTK